MNQVNDIRGWRFVFNVQLPLIVIYGILVACVVKIPVKEKSIWRIRLVNFLEAFTIFIPPYRWNLEVSG